MHWSYPCDNLPTLSNLLIFTSFLKPFHLDNCSSSHLLVFHIFSSAKLLIFTFAPLDTCSLYTFFHTFSSSHLTFSSSHFLSHVVLPSHLPLSFLSLSLPFQSPFSLSRLLCRSTLSHEMLVDRPKFRTKWSSIIQNRVIISLLLKRPFRTIWGSASETEEKKKFTCHRATLSNEMIFYRPKNELKLRRCTK